MNYSTQSFLDRVNLFRTMENLNSINGYYCNTCGEKNSHTTYECTKNRCKICWNSHLTKYCEYLNKCQWCNGNHSNKICNKYQEKANSWSTCILCGNLGHIAKQCNSRHKGKNGIIIKKTRKHKHTK